VPIADLHSGKYVYGAESWGEDYDTDKAAERLYLHGVEVAKAIKESPAGHADIVWNTDLGDLFHAIDGKTENNTLLHQDTRGTRVIEKTMEGRIAGLEAILEATDRIIVKRARGNHDHLWNHQFYRELRALYTHHPRIDVEFSATPNDYFIAGTDEAGYSPHVLVHGRGIGKLNQPGVIRKAMVDCNNIVKQASPDGDKFKRWFYYCGHLHHEEVVEEDNFILRRLPSMSENDDYEEGLHVMSYPRAKIFQLDAAGRQTNSRTIYF
jgi:hypothetical protein